MDLSPNVYKCYFLSDQPISCLVSFEPESGVFEKVVEVVYYNIITSCIRALWHTKTYIIRINTQTTNTNTGIYDMVVDILAIYH